MDLKTYLKGKDRYKFAKAYGIKKSYLDLLCCGQRVPSRKLALKIEQKSDGQVTRMELLYPDESKAA